MHAWSFSAPTGRGVVSSLMDVAKSAAQSAQCGRIRSILALSLLLLPAGLQASFHSVGEADGDPGARGHPGPKLLNLQPAAGPSSPLTRDYSSRKMPRLRPSPLTSPPGSGCPDDIATKISQAGHLSVDWTGAVGTLPAGRAGAPAPPPHDDSPGVQRALQLSALCGGSAIYFPGQVVYHFYSTVNITQQAVLLIGGEGRIHPGVGSVQGLMSASATFIQASSIPSGGPAFFLNSSESMIELQNFAIEAGYTGIHFSNCEQVACIDTLMFGAGQHSTETPPRGVH